MRKTKEDAELTRQAILNAAARLFARKGFAKSSLEEIAKEANVTRGAVYWHFKNKAEIFDALHELIYLPLADLIAEDLQDDRDDPLAQLRDFCIQLMLGVEEDEQTKQTLTLLLVKQDYSGELAEYRDKHYQRKVDSLNLIRFYFERARHQGQLTADADIALLTKSVNCFIRGIMSEYFEYPDQCNLRERVPPLMTLFFNNLTAGCRPT